MNPTDYGNGMLWMGQFPQDRMILDENAMLSVGMSVMDDSQSHSMVNKYFEFCSFNCFLVFLINSTSRVWKKNANGEPEEISRFFFPNSYFNHTNCNFIFCFQQKKKKSIFLFHTIFSRKWIQWWELWANIPQPQLLDQ